MKQLLILTLSLLSISVFAQKKVKEGLQLIPHFRKLNKTLAQNTQEFKKIAYGTEKRQYLLELSPKEQAPKANIIFFHGGGWHVGNPEQNLPLAKILVEAGYQVYMPAYRLGPKNDFYAIQADVDSAVINCLRLIKEKGLEHNDLIIGGTSAGANLAGLLAFDQKRLAQVGISKQQLKGCFTFAGVLDLNELPQNNVTKNYAGKKGSAKHQAANAFRLIDAQDQLPFLSMHGTIDAIVPIASSDNFCAKIREFDASLVQQHRFEEATHTDISSRWYYTSKAYYMQDILLKNWLSKVLKD